MLINISVWKHKESLFDYTYSTQHVEILKRKMGWFHHIKKMRVVLWNIEKDHIPTLDVAQNRLEYP